MALARFDPFRDLMELQHRINRLFEETSRGGREELTRTVWSPSVDIYEEPAAIVIEADLPGMSKDQVTVNLKNNVLTIQGERKLEHEEKRDNYHRIERAYGSFTRSFTIPSNINTEQIEAEFKDGVLRIQLPKREEAKPKQVTVRVK